MTIIELPFFLTNSAWYTYERGRGYILTDIAPAEAIESYIEYNKVLEERNILKG